MTTSSTTHPDFETRVDLRRPERLIASVPYLLGFTPADSLVLLVHASDGPESHIVSHVMRVDIPDAAAVPELAPTLDPALTGAAAVTVVLVGGDPPDDGPAHRDVMAALSAVMTDLGVPINHALWTPEIRIGARWRCYADESYADESCAGELPDPAASTTAAVTTHAGQVTYASRDAMAHTLDPESDEALARRAALLELAACRDEAEPADVDDEIARAYAIVRDALERFRTGADAGTRPALADQEIVDLARALAHHEVRDAAFSVCWPPRSEVAVAAEHLWTALVRGVPPPERAEPASLLAYTAYLRGDGPLAGMAVANALEACPGHTLAKLFDQALVHAVPPEKLAGLARDRRGALSAVAGRADDAGARARGPGAGGGGTVSGAARNGGPERSGPG
ncbi:DUF4192 domain-containing protein [Prauserella halophila]|uniref:DUF4192 domain-containing protein n=1 Tax=Prauserella halophila TaxID=185641 RepID=A0ABP4GN28_9PSEU|nr:DUF4192 domain-containing protein [Prauserella halophila]MCP2236534.1 protein of unknown function (DUF4192) [Prauserella halophila]